MGAQADVLVACVLKSGGPYTPEYVDRLKQGVDKNLSGHEFVCLSDIEVPCKRIPLVNNYSGWWSKIELLRITGSVLYFDLDTVITGDLSDIAHYPHRFTMLKDFSKDTPASGVMAWNGDFSHVYRDFDPNKVGRYPGHGDQGYIGSRVDGIEYFQDLFPSQIVSRKQPENRNDDERVVCFHGIPRPHEVNWSI